MKRVPHQTKKTKEEHVQYKKAETKKHEITGHIVIEGRRVTFHGDAANSPSRAVPAAAVSARAAIAQSFTYPKTTTTASGLNALRFRLKMLSLASSTSPSSHLSFSLLLPSLSLLPDASPGASMMTARPARAEHASMRGPLSSSSFAARAAAHAGRCITVQPSEIRRFDRAGAPRSAVVSGDERHLSTRGSCPGVSLRGLFLRRARGLGGTSDDSGRRLREWRGTYRLPRSADKALLAYIYMQGDDDDPWLYGINDGARMKNGRLPCFCSKRVAPQRLEDKSAT
ncbi:hypothetical protein HYPSUDRAFT_208456 [Hypholoma sublateritium FD-334 SS-4]|uniref:Uncharacterized protein n=1 Tax=Hypholoma sublateritium (strain FD-334 SS-4) TaxID=945553 RepID=A0A0D2LV93_HYPSF|nr:hypothetical protein HYPSUDRAFT_208456 [Hypholoma sublateritium FD-334 SS-4]